MALVPLAGRDYYATLMLPFFGYGIALLGLNLLFGYTGLLSFGHALFVAVGAYTAAYLTGIFGVLHFELILLTAAGAAALVAVPTGLLAVRYVKIYFGMLTLAFGMLFYSFLLKFYHLTGGDEGMRVLRPILARPTPDRAGTRCRSSSAPTTITAWACSSWPPWPCGASSARRSACACAPSGKTPTRQNPSGVSVQRYRFYAFLIASVFGGVGGVLLAVPTGLADPLLAYWTHSGNLVFMLLLGGFASFLGPLLGAFVFIFLQDQVMSFTPVLALRLRRHPRGRRHLLSSRSHGTSRARGTRPLMALLEAVGVTKFYGDVCALAGVSLSVSGGEFVSIIGPNGAGKTTLVNVLTGLTPPSSGSVRFKDRDVAGVGPGRLARLGMARSFQLVTIFPGLTVEETLAAAVVSRRGRTGRLWTRLAADLDVRAQVRAVADLFGLGDRLGSAGPHPAPGRQEVARRRQRVRAASGDHPARRADVGRQHPRQARDHGDACRRGPAHRHSGHHPGRARHGHRLRLLRPHRGPARRPRPRRRPPRCDPRRRDT